MIHFSVIPYVNALPLTDCLPKACPDACLVPALPSESLALLGSSESSDARIIIAVMHLLRLNVGCEYSPR